MARGSSKKTKDEVETPTPEQVDVALEQVEVAHGEVVSDSVVEAPVQKTDNVKATLHSGYTCFMPRDKAVHQKAQGLVASIDEIK